MGDATFGPVHLSLNSISTAPRVRCPERKSNRPTTAASSPSLITRSSSSAARWIKAANTNVLLSALDQYFRAG
jgi:hypothetical protein